MRMNWDEIRDRLQHLIDARGTNATQLTEKCGVPQPTIQRFLTKVTGYMELDNLAAIAAALQCTVAEIIGEQPLETDEKIRRVLLAMQNLPEYKKDVLVSTADTLAANPEKKAIR